MIAKLRIRASLIAASLIFPSLSHSQSLTDAKADAIVRQQAEADNAALQERRDALEATEADAEVVVANGNRTVLLRRVESIDSPVQMRESPPVFLSEEEAAARAAALKQAYYLTISVKVYDKQLSEIFLRSGSNTYTAWSRTDLTYLPSMKTLETEDVTFSYFASVINQDSSTEQRWAELQFAKGIDYEPRAFPSLYEVFGSRTERYFVTPDQGVQVPVEINGFLAAVHAYYDENEESLIELHKCQRTLDEARKRYLEANPPKPKDLVINYSRVK